MSKRYDVVIGCEYLGQVEYDGPAECLEELIDGLDDNARGLLFRRLRAERDAREQVHQEIWQIERAWGLDPLE